MSAYADAFEFLFVSLIVGVMHSMTNQINPYHDDRRSKKNPQHHDQMFFRCVDHDYNLFYFCRLCQHPVQGLPVGGHDVDDGEPAKGVLLAALCIGNGFVTDEILDHLAPV